MDVELGDVSEAPPSAEENLAYLKDLTPTSHSHLNDSQPTSHSLFETPGPIPHHPLGSSRPTSPSFSGALVDPRPTSPRQRPPIFPVEKPKTPFVKFKAALHRYKAVVLVCFLAVFCLSAGVGVYYATVNNEWISIHLVPHSHDDVGWIMRPETYYDHTVKYILNNVIHELQKDPHRRFVYVETYFFWRWWNQQSAEVQSLVKHLVNNGQLEFAGGAWSMNDEATPNYLSIIDQFTWGLRRLNDTFGPRGRPNVAWQIDTFGHSREMASLSSLMGFRGLFFARIDEQEREHRKRRREMEFYWKDRDTSILTSVMFKHYNPPSGYHFEKETNEGANLDGFLDAVREWAAAYKTKNVLVPMGDDFTYYDAEAWFHNMDALIREVNKRRNTGINVNMFYSSPSEYLRAIEDSVTEFSVKKDSDLFPYSSDTFSFWTGYFTSRPSFKRFERVASNFMQMVKQMFVLSGLSSVSDNFELLLTDLRESLGVILHHDAITGTAKQHVTDHYVAIVHRAMMSCLQPFMESLRLLSVSHGKVEPLAYQPCLLLNSSTCFTAERSMRFVVLLYNPLSWPVSRPVRLPVLAQFYSVRNSYGDLIPSQIVVLPSEVINLPGRASAASKELVFQSGLIPPFGFLSFYIAAEPFPVGVDTPTPKNIELNFNRYSNLMAGLNKNGEHFNVGQTIEYYWGSSFWTGAYIFRPAERYPYSLTERVLTNVTADGAVVKEIHQSFGTWVNQVLRVYDQSPVVEVEWTVGPIPVEDYHGKEVVIKYWSDVKSQKEFYTDTNGRGSLRRVRDKRDYWDYDPHESISGNYYPVTSHISVRDEATHMYVLTDRAQGGSSIRNGEVELMVHRRLCYDDGKGVNEPLNETEFDQGLVARGRHWLLIGKSDPQLEISAKLMGMELQLEPILFISSTDLTFQQWQTSHFTSFDGLTSSLPSQIRVLTLEPWRDGLVLLRLEHMFEKDAALPFSQPATVTLNKLFRSFTVVSCRETALGADRWLVNDRGWMSGDIRITLQPTAIRTFLVQILPV